MFVAPHHIQLCTALLFCGGVALAWWQGHRKGMKTGSTAAKDAEQVRVLKKAIKNQKEDSKNASD